MNYKELIEETKSKIDNYAFDDSAYSAIYDEAKKRLQEAYRANEENINASLSQERQKAAGENALTTKSLREDLAKRGLARSGDSALLSINQSISLRNALAALSSEAIKSKNELYSQHQKELAELSADLGKQKANAAEQEKKSLYERLSDLEAGQAGEEKWRAELENDKDKWASQLKADEEKWRAELENDKDKWTSELKNDSDKWRAELSAKLSSAASGGSGSGGGSGVSDGSSGKGGATGSDFLTGLTSGSDGVTPKYSAEKIADSVLENCGITDGQVRGSYIQTRIYKELARVIVSSNYSKEYALEVLGILRSRGFTQEFDLGLMTGDLLKQTYYAYQKMQRQYYTELKQSGYEDNEAVTNANNRATQYIRSYVNSLKLSDGERQKLLDALWLIR